MDTGKITGGDGRAWCKDDGAAHCYVSFFPLTKGNYHVTDTDYTSYTVVRNCQTYLGAFHREFFWILTRAETPDQSVTDTAEAIITANAPYYDQATRMRSTYQGSNCNYTP